MFRISWKQDYGMQFLSLLSISHGKRLISLSQAAKTLSISPLYLKKVAADLKKSGLVASKEGVTGGYHLSPFPQKNFSKNWLGKICRKKFFLDRAPPTYVDREV